MAKFCGEVGFSEVTETAPGIWTDQIRTRSYTGDVYQFESKRENGSEIHDDVVMVNRISIIFDEYAAEHYFAIRFVKWAGVCWEVTSVKVQSPRLILSMGGVYHGPTGWPT